MWLLAVILPFHTWNTHSEEASHIFLHPHKSIIWENFSCYLDEKEDFTLFLIIKTMEIGRNISHICIHTHTHIHTYNIDSFTYCSIWLPLLTYKGMTQQNPIKTTLYCRSDYVPRKATINLDLLLMVYDTGLHSTPKHYYY